MEISYSNSGSKLIVYVTGKLDTTTCSEFDENVGNKLKDCEELILDFENLEYISSAGLRSILKLKKSVDKFEIINVSSDVYEILSMTGFTEIMDVKKAMRKVSIEGCNLIGEGAVGIVYRIAPDTVVKVYKSKDVSLEDIANESKLAKKAFVLGVPTAISYDVVKVGDKYGAVFELLDAETCVNAINKDIKNIDKYVNDYVQVMKTIHNCELKPGELPNILDKFNKYFENSKDFFDNDTKAKLEALVKGCIPNNHMIHGDYHIKNLMLQKGEPFLIDMDTLCLGSPIFEFGFMYSCYCSYQSVDKLNGEHFFGLKGEYINYIFNKSIDLYFPNFNESDKENFINKLKIISYLQLLPRFYNDPERQEEFKLFVSEIKDLVNKVDSLNL